MASKLPNARIIALAGLAAGAAAATALKTRRKKTAAVLGRAAGPTPAPAPSAAPVGVAAGASGPVQAPAVANADVAGPPANTSTHVPAPEPEVASHLGTVTSPEDPSLRGPYGETHPTGGIDEASEEAAAAAEAANIGGLDPAYAGTEPGELVDDADRALAESGEGESEGEEQAEAELVDNAEPAAGDPLQGGRQIDEAIEAQDEPLSGELGEPDPEGASDLAAEQAEQAVDEDVLSGHEVSEDDAPDRPETGTSAEQPSSGVWSTDGPEQPTVEQPKVRPED